MKLVFLDIDGVLNCQTTKERFHRFLGIDPIKADLVKKIVEETGAEIILSSTWRKEPEFQAEVERFLGKINKATPILRMSRGHEIMSYLRGLDRNPEVFAILDDDLSVGRHNELLPSWFRTDFYGDGLTEDITENVIKYLGKK